MSTATENKIPAAALMMRTGRHLAAASLGANDEHRVRILARTGDVIEHWWWGRVVHDFDGMQVHKSKLAIDYAHDESEIIGYADEFDTSSGDLWLRGRLVSFRDDDRASEVIHKSRQGVPYEASIYFDGPLRLEEIDAGISVNVNGRELMGPLVVIREWSLRGCAICPHGADRNTETTNFQNAFSNYRAMADARGIFSRRNSATAAPVAQAGTQNRQPEPGGSRAVFNRRFSRQLGKTEQQAAELVGGSNKPEVPTLASIRAASRVRRK